ncbi:MAG: TMEM175 family protein [Bacteroidetes bacterium]|nr:TMEM175 family protein [Bacteroidota bacterium]
MPSGRLEAFSDGVMAILITIMVLELAVPHHRGHGVATMADLRPLVPVLLSYVLSFVYLVIYWNNHHHLLRAAPRVSGATLWANLHLLFWLSLVPFATAWMGENGFAPHTLALYGIVLFGCGFAYLLLEITLMHTDESISQRLLAVLDGGLKEKISMLLYLVGIGLSFVQPAIAGAIYVLVALVWLVPDRRLEQAMVD